MDLNDELVNDFEQIKISVCNKLQKINIHSIKDVTLGPNSLKRVKDQVNGLSHQNDLVDGNIQVVTINDNALPVRLAVQELEYQRQQKLNESIKARIRKFTDFTNKQDLNQKQQWLNAQQAFIADVEKKENSILDELEKYDKKTSNKHAILVQHYQLLAAKRQKDEEELHQREKHRQTLNANIEKTRTCQKEYSSEYQQIVAILKTAVSQEELKKHCEKDIMKIKILHVELDEIIKKCKTGEVTEEDAAKAVDIVNNIKIIKSEIQQSIIAINNKKEEVIEAPKEILNIPKPVISHVESIRTTTATEPAPETTFPNKNECVETQTVNISQFVSINNLKMYSEIMDFLDNHNNSFKELLDDTSLKQFKFDCKKAVNIPVNAISAVNVQHLSDKYTRLYKLMAGQTVTISDKQFNAARHPQGIAFCMDLLAQKFVLQGDLMISSNPEAAFCYATVVVSLWNDFPVFGKLLLAYFYKFCPYLVPYYVPQNVGETDEEYYIRQGYQYTNGQIEKQDKFLKRMTGITRLYFAILITKPKKGQNSTPYNIQHGWRWLASLLKMEPRLDITATMLHTFLDTVGFEMEATYGRVFQKLLKIIFEKFLLICRKKCTGGAVIRLELLLSEYLKNGRFEKPPGYTPYAYW